MWKKQKLQLSLLHLLLYFAWLFDVFVSITLQHLNSDSTSCLGVTLFD